VTKEVTMTILVTYASKHGSTLEVAKSVAAHLTDSGLDTDLRPAVDVHDVEGYDGVVLGTALYMGRVHRDARSLLRRIPPTKPFAVFAMGPLTLKEHDVAGARKQLDAALKKAPAPFAVAIFGGVLHQDEQRFPFNHMPETDARDWEAIGLWAKEVAAGFYERNPASADSTRSASVARL
jgi:menaquinone-dependent protoporphyrinogen oxidase